MSRSNAFDLLQDLPSDLSGLDIEEIRLFVYDDYTIGQTLYDLGMNLEEYLIVSILLLEDSIAEQKLSEITSIPRSTVRGRLDDAVNMKIAARSEKGVSLTEEGRKLFVLMSRDISNRASTGEPLSKELCAVLEGLTLSDGVTRPFKVPDRLRPRSS